MRLPSVLAAVLAAGLAVLLSACAGTSGGAPTTSPSDFGSFAATLSARGVSLTNVVAGDAGCTDPTLASTAISFRVSGLDQPTPVAARVFLFGSGASYDRLRQSVDACAGWFVSDPSAYVSIDASPYVLVGQGPWGPQLQAALKAALEGAAAGR